MVGGERDGGGGEGEKGVIHCMIVTGGHLSVCWIWPAGRYGRSGLLTGPLFFLCLLTFSTVLLTRSSSVASTAVALEYLSLFHHFSVVSCLNPCCSFPPFRFSNLKRTHYLLVVSFVCGPNFKLKIQNAFRVIKLALI